MCTVLHATPSSKPAASEIVFRMCNKEKVGLDLLSSCKTLEFDADFDSEFEFD